MSGALAMVVVMSCQFETRLSNAVDHAVLYLCLIILCPIYELKQPVCRLWSRLKSCRPENVNTGVCMCTVRVQACEITGQKAWCPHGVRRRQWSCCPQLQCKSCSTTACAISIVFHSHQHHQQPLSLSILKHVLARADCVNAASYIRQLQMHHL